MTRRFDPDNAARDVVVFAERCEPGEGAWHEHRRAQLVHASSGVLTVHTALGMWVVPPHRGVWVTPRTPHRISSSTAFWLHTLYADPEAVRVPAQCCVIELDRLVQELLIAACRFPADYPAQGPERRLVEVILDRLPVKSVVALHLPQPADPRLLRITAKLTHEPSDDSTLEALTQPVGLTVRTAARLFRKETGLTFVQWRQQLRLLSALERLGAGESVTAVALDVGYRDVSSFIAVFKAAFGTTPARYFD